MNILVDIFDRFELEETRNELDDVKELYVKACNEKDELENQMNREWEEKLSQDLEKVRIKWCAHKYIMLLYTVMTVGISVNDSWNFMSNSELQRWVGFTMKDAFMLRSQL